MKMASKPKTETASAKTANADEFSTEDFNAIRMGAGSLPEEGITFTAQELVEGEGKFGKFWQVKGVNDEEKKVELTFSSQKLHAMVEKNWSRIEGKTVNIRGVGEKFDREYYLKLV